MELKLGSKGNEVKVLQRALHLIGFLAANSDDGVFGKLTENAVKELQKSRGLKVDGIVGNKTWAILLNESSNDIVITNGYISTHITPSKGRFVKYIAVHYTAGGTSKKGTALNTRNVFLKRQASADFVVDDGSIVQINPDLKNYYCWSVGDKKNVYSGGGRLFGVANNRNTISIEICSNLMDGWSAAFANHKGWYFTDASLDNALKLIRYLMKIFGVPKSNVVRHYDISGKLCPGIVGWNDAPVYNNDGKKESEKSNSTQWLSFWSKI